MIVIKDGEVFTSPFFISGVTIDRYEDASITRGMNGGILTLLGIIGAVQVGFVAMFAGFIVRSKKLLPTNEVS